MANTYVLIEAKTLASAVTSITFSAIPSTYTDILFKVSLRTNGSTDAYFIRPNATTSNITQKNIQGYGSSVASGSATTLAAGVPVSSYTANTFGNDEIYIPNYAGSNYKSVSIDSVPENNATTTRQVLEAGLWSDTTAISSMKFETIDGSFVQYCTLYLYGISNS
jgi:hypothetical protein